MADQQKTVAVVIPSGQDGAETVLQEVTVVPGSTAQDVLNSLGKGTGYILGTMGGAVFRGKDLLFNQIDSGDKLAITPSAEAGASAPAPQRAGLLARLGRAFSGASTPGEQQSRALVAAPAPARTAAPGQAVRIAPDTRPRGGRRAGKKPLGASMKAGTCAPSAPAGAEWSLIAPDGSVASTSGTHLDSSGSHAIPRRCALVTRAGVNTRSTCTSSRSRWTRPSPLWSVSSTRPPRGRRGGGMNKVWWPAASRLAPHRLATYLAKARTWLHSNTKEQKKMSNWKSITPQLDRTLDLVRAGKQEARQGIDRSLEEGEKIAADIHYGYLWRLRDIERELALARLPEASPVPTYVMGTLFLERCREELTRDEKEAMFYISGVEEAGFIYLTDILTFGMSSRSVGGVHGDDESVFQAMMKLQRAGQRLYAWFHSHPGSRDTCAPSGTDMRMQQRLESLHYPAIGGIFTRDGFLRFFAAQRRFQLQFHGKGVTDVDAATFLYKIELPG